MNTQHRPKATTKQRQRSLATSSEALFTHNGWRIWVVDDKNIGLIHEHEGPNKVRYYSSLESALKGLVKQIGFVCTDLNDCMERIEELHRDIRRAGI